MERMWFSTYNMNHKFIMWPNILKAKNYEILKVYKSKNPEYTVVNSVWKQRQQLSTHKTPKTNDVSL